MIPKRPKGARDPSQKTLQRWDTEGGAPCGGRVSKRQDFVSSRRKEAASRASKMAGTEIDYHADLSAPVAEQERRKRRLLNGPKEFRDFRRDHPKAKD